MISYTSDMTLLLAASRQVTLVNSFMYRLPRGKETTLCRQCFLLSEMPTAAIAAINNSFNVFQLNYLYMLTDSLKLDQNNEINIYIYFTFFLTNAF
jgi:hypothetical protein